MIAWDTETTGVDFKHGARPFFFTTCNHDDEQYAFEWDVDPYDREVQIPRDHVEQIISIFEAAAQEDPEPDDFILHNAKFDVMAMAHVHSWFKKNWPWHRTSDTIIGSHLLNSGYKHNLTDCCKNYLHFNIAPFEDKLGEACQTARRLAKRKFPEWELAAKTNPKTPSAKSEKSKVWKYDYWLPRALVMELGYDRITEYTENKDHNWDTLLREYAAADSYFTRKLWLVMKRMIKELNFQEIFRTRMKLIPIALKMEMRGVTLSKQRLLELRADYEMESTTSANICRNIAECYTHNGSPFNLELSKGVTKSLQTFTFDVMQLGHVDGTSLDKEVLDQWVKELDPNTLELTFIRNLAGKRKRDTALTYMEGYQRFWISTGVFNEKGEQLWYTLHPSLNPTGTAHLRWSCKNPNEQNISKQEGFNLRYMFGPAPGREWWSLDAQNIELRIPTFEAGERDLMEVFLRPKDPPYYGSYHLVIFDLLHPDLFREHGKACKDLFESTWYQWVKNGNFAIIYGAQEAKADATYHVKGAFQLVRHRFPKIAQLADRQMAEANRTGGIHTVADKTVNPRKGYPIQCTRGDGYGNRVKPTLPLNYHVSGSAMWWTGKGMIRCDEQLVEWEEREQFDAYINMQVHDELVFDIPRYQWQVQRVISGGQTGVDQAGLRAAYSLALETGGLINLGFKTLDGEDYSLKKYGLEEMQSRSYKDRTYANVKNSDATIRFASDWNSPGERCTANAIRQFGKPSLDISRDDPPKPQNVVQWLIDNDVQTLNIAGNSESTSPGIGKLAEKYLQKVFTLLNPNLGRVSTLQKLMEQGGDDIGIPTPVGCEYNPRTWDKGIAI